MHRQRPLTAAWLAAAVLIAPTSLGAATEVSPAARWFDAHRDRPPMLRQFLQRMPKGADLHSHFSGAIYAESFLGWAAGDGDCIDTRALTLVPAPCKPGGPLAAAGAIDDTVYNAMVDRMSTKDLAQSGRSGHDQFFGTFSRFGLVGDDPRHGAAMLTEITNRAAGEHILHLELISGIMRDCKDAQDTCIANLAGRLDLSALGVSGTDGGGSAEPPNRDASQDPHADPQRTAAFTAMQGQLQREGLPQLVAEASQSLTALESAYAQAQSCGGRAPAPGCAVSVRWEQETIRSQTPARVFTELAYAFALAAADPRVVAVNLVAPEDDPVALRDYDLHMQMVAFFARQSPQVRISLHAGELTLGLVPPERLRGHVRKAVRMAGAQRIGHGVDIGYEDAALETLKTMRERGIAVEVCLTSNDLILGVKGRDHPLPDYLAAGVPVVLASDDQGVSRIDLTNEYLRAVLDYRLYYPQLKQLSRNGLTYSFLPGASLWHDPASARPVAECAHDEPGGEAPSETCQRWLAGSEKARRQWDLEAALRTFEQSADWRMHRD